MRVRAKRNAKGSRKTKVSKLEHATAVNEQVLRLEVAMQDATTMAEQETFEELPAVALHQESQELARTRQK